MPDTERRKNLFLIACCALALAAYLALNWGWFRSVCDRSGDYALIRLQTERAKHFEALEGPYSRFGLRHPAPTYFYLYAALAPAAPFAETRHGSYSFAQFLINGAFLAAGTLLARRVTGSLFGGGAYLFLMLLFTELARPGALSDIWGPSTLILPVSCFLLASARFGAGDLRVFPLWLASALLPLSNHLASLVVLGPIGLAALACAALNRRAAHRPLERSEKLALGAGALVAALTAAPVLIEALRAGGGNLRALFEFSAGASRSLPREPLASFEFLAAYYTKPLGLREWPRMLLAGILLLLPWLPPRALSREERLLRVFLTLAVPFGLSGFESVPGKEYRYVLMFWFGIGALQWLVALSWAARALRWAALRAAGAARERFVDRLLRTAAAVSLIGVTAGFFPSLERPERGCGGALDRAVDAVLAEPAELYAFSIRHPSQWGMLAGVVDRVYAAGAHPCVPRLWEFMFTAPLVCAREALCDPHRAVRQLVLLRKDEPPPASSAPVADADGVRIAEYDAEWRRRACEQ